MIELPLTPPSLDNGKNFSGCVRDGSYMPLCHAKATPALAAVSPAKSDCCCCFDSTVINNQCVASTISLATSVNSELSTKNNELDELMSLFAINQYGSFLPDDNGSSQAPSSGSPVVPTTANGDGKQVRPVSSLPPTPSSQSDNEPQEPAFERLIQSFGIDEYATLLPSDAYLTDEAPYSPEGDGMDSDEDCQIDVEAFSDEFDEFMSEVSGEEESDSDSDDDDVAYYRTQRFSPYQGSNIYSVAPVQAAY